MISFEVQSTSSTLGLWSFIIHSDFSIVSHQPHCVCQKPLAGGSYPRRRDGQTWSERLARARLADQPISLLGYTSSKGDSSPQETKIPLIRIDTYQRVTTLQRLGISVYWSGSITCIIGSWSRYGQFQPNSINQTRMTSQICRIRPTSHT